MVKKRSCKRQRGARYENGRLKPATHSLNSRPSRKPTFEPLTGTHLQRMSWLAKQGAIDPRAAADCAIGRLHYLAELSVVQATAGNRMIEIYGRNEGLSRHNPAAQSPSCNPRHGHTATAGKLPTSVAVARPGAHAVVARDRAICIKTRQFPRPDSKARWWWRISAPPEKAIAEDYLRPQRLTACVIWPDQADICKALKSV
jgi:hypothetical protein